MPYVHYRGRDGSSQVAWVSASPSPVVENAKRYEAQRLALRRSSGALIEAIFAPDLTSKSKEPGGRA